MEFRIHCIHDYGDDDDDVVHNKPVVEVHNDDDEVVHNSLVHSDDEVVHIQNVVVVHIHNVVVRSTFLFIN